MKIPNFFLRIFIFLIPLEFSTFFNFGQEFLLTKIISVAYCLSVLQSSGLLLFTVIKKYLFFIFLISIVVFTQIFMEFYYSNNFFYENSNLIFLQNLFLLVFFIVHINLDKYGFENSLRYFFFSFLIVILACFIDFESQTNALAGRLTVLNINQNLLGNYFVIFLFILNFKTNINKILKLFLTIISIYFLFQTGSRQAFLFFGFMIVVFFFLNNRSNSIDRFIFLFPIIFFTIIISDFFIKNTNVGQRISSTLNIADLSGREALLLIYPTILQDDEKIFGIGSSEFKRRAISKIGRFTVSHNVFLDQYIKTGIFGLSSLVILFFILMRRSLINFKLKRDISYMIYLSFLIITSLVAHPFGTRLMWIFFAIMIYNYNKKNERISG